MIALVIAAGQGLALCCLFTPFRGERGFLDNHALLGLYHRTVAFPVAQIRWIDRLGHKAQRRFLADTAYHVNHTSPHIQG
ncbi:hypothetical protein ASF73_17300 [Xanthomonas sp. Leaf131]|nr:hypothetical protein ASF73_17300 [Xanthomonas sp. Leaf131]